MQAKHQVYLGLGSNLEGPEEQILQTIEHLNRDLNVSNVKHSNMVFSPPMGGPEQPNYVNSVCSFQTNCSPNEVLDLIRDLEQKQGRKRDLHWGPRTIDIDILLFDDLIICNHELQIPHPGIHEREFVLVPLLELNKSLIDPISGYPYSKLLEILLTKQPSILLESPCKS